tara:strand:- start:1478 stop:1597 length:120 start_codon:yes stop_codon:yes gene_type:complete
MKKIFLSYSFDRDPQDVSEEEEDNILEDNIDLVRKILDW